MHAKRGSMIVTVQRLSGALAICATLFGSAMIGFAETRDSQATCRHEQTRMESEMALFNVYVGLWLITPIQTPTANYYLGQIALHSDRYDLWKDAYSLGGC